MRDRTIQILSVLAAVAALFVAGTLLPRIVAASDEGKLRYTNVSVEGAPPIVAIGAAVGALRGLVVDYLWIRLQQMRDNSPTGGALGAVAVQELTALQSTVASLDQLQSPSQLGKALEKIEGHYTRWLDVMKQSGGGQGGATGNWGDKPAASKGGPVDFGSLK